MNELLETKTYRKHFFERDVPPLLNATFDSDEQNSFWLFEKLSDSNRDKNGDNHCHLSSKITSLTDSEEN